MLTEILNVFTESYLDVPDGNFIVFVELTQTLLTDLTTV